jgi:hypothetical protein
MATDPYSILLLSGGLLASLPLAYLSMRAARKRRHIRDTPTSKTAGVFIGDVEVKGTAEIDRALVSYLAERRCVHYEWSVAEHWRRTVVESYTDSKGNRRTRTRVESGWTTVASGGESRPFYVLDDTGHILVRPEGMTVEGRTVFSLSCGPGHAFYYGRGPSGAIANSTFTRQFSETAVPLHEPVFVMGRARQRADVVAAEIAHDRDARFSLVTLRSEDDVARGYGTTGWVLGVVGLVVATAGGVIGVAGEAQGDRGVLALWGGMGVAGYLAALALLWAVMTFNALVALRERVRRGWANIDVELKRRADLIPNLAETVKGARAHEADTQRLLALLRTQAAVDPAAVRDGRATVEGIAPAVVALAEAYPDLRAGANFLALQEELTRTESRIALARTYYNGMVKAFNARIAVVPDSMLARLGGLKPFAFFEAKGLEREAVVVDFAS